jgi:transcriptional regulator with XRE-family HTH domain
MLANIGTRLRLLRQERDLTLADVSAETGISVSTLSRLESGERRATLELLLPLARAYGVTLDELVDAPPTGDPRVHLRPVTRGGMTMIPLTKRAGGIQAYKLVLAAGTRREPDPQSHEGYEWLYVLNGRLRVVLGSSEFVLSPGEAAEFDTRVPHWFGPADSDSAELLSLFGTQGERAHLRARPRLPLPGEAHHGPLYRIQLPEYVPAAPQRHLVVADRRSVKPVPHGPPDPSRHSVRMELHAHRHVLQSTAGRSPQLGRWRLRVPEHRLEDQRRLLTARERLVEQNVDAVQPAADVIDRPVRSPALLDLDA